MSHTWVTPSSSTRVQGQSSSSRHIGRQEPGHLHTRGERPDAQLRRPGAVASTGMRSSEDERGGYGRTQPLDRSDRRCEGEGTAGLGHMQPLSGSGGLQRYFNNIVHFPMV